MDSDDATLVLRRRKSTGSFVASPIKITVRRDGKPAWFQHPRQDVAVLPLTDVAGVDLKTLSTDDLATADDWKQPAIGPGSLVRCVGFPHAAQFKPNAAGVPLTRLGCIASYPLTPYATHPTFLVDYNSFEGDSGGPVYLETGPDRHKVIGLVHGQHFLDERYKLVYTQGLIRKRLGLAIIVNSLAILEVIDELPN